MMKCDKCDGLYICEIWPVSLKYAENGGIGISWCGAVGFGELALFWGDDGKLHATTEHMDSEKDKRFTEKLLELLVEQIVIDD